MLGFVGLAYDAEALLFLGADLSLRSGVRIHSVDEAMRMLRDVGATGRVRGGALAFQVPAKHEHHAALGGVIATFSCLASRFGTAADGAHTNALRPWRVRRETPTSSFGAPFARADWPGDGDDGRF